MDFSNAMADYLAWMAFKRYSVNTVQNYKHYLKHYQRFITNRKIPWQESFQLSVLKDFQENESNKVAIAPVKGIAKYLHDRGLIPSAIKKECIKLPDAYENFLISFEATRGPGYSYLKEARKVLGALHQFLENRNIILSRITISDVDQFLAEIQYRRCASRRRNNRAHLRNFFNYLYHERKTLKRNIAPLIVGATEFARQQPPKFLRPDEVDRIFAGLSLEDNRSLREAAMIHLAFLLGLRPIEVSKIRMDDIAFSQELIHLPDRKSDNPISLPLPEETIKVIAAYVIGARPESEHRQLFLDLTAPYGPVTAATVSVVIGRAVKRVNPQATAYWLRHTYAQNLLQAGVSIFEVKEMMGHDCIQSTRRYLHINLPLMRSLFDE
jgi:site-specific recombinase XerD